jgi:F420H(2)-dependent quinone reductase
LDVDAVQRSVFRLHQGLYERTDGRLGHRLIGVPSLLLRTTGRRSGVRRTSTLVYGRDGDAFVVVGSNGGDDREPAWLLNIRDDPRVTVQVGRRKAPAVARVVDGDDPDHARLWALMNRVNKDRYTAYQTRTERPIALVSLTPTQPLA